MPASSIMTSFDACETDGLSSSSCTIFLYYTTIRKSSIYKVITNESQKSIICLFITCNYDFYLFLLLMFAIPVPFLSFPQHFFY